MITTVVVSVIIAAIVIWDIRYIIKRKKAGGCIGCPASGGKCTCHCNEQK